MTLGGDGGPPGLRHRALIGSPVDRDDAMDGVVAGALDADDPLLLVVDDAAAARLRQRHGRRLTPGSFLPAGEYYTQPAWTLARLRQEVETRTAGGATLRVVAEPRWWDRTAAEHAAWLSAEAVANVAFAAVPVDVLCAYDRNAPPEVLDGVRHTHPEVVVDGRPRHNAAYTDPALYCTRHRDHPLSPLLAPVEEHPFNGATLAGLRRAVAAWATAGGLAPRRVPEVVLAVHEVAANSVRHGGGEGTLRLAAASGGELVAEVEDAGVIVAPFAGLLPPPRTGDGGYGLWLVHQLVELVEIRSGPSGSVVRLHAKRLAGPAS